MNFLMPTKEEKRLVKATIEDLKLFSVVGLVTDEGGNQKTVYYVEKRKEKNFGEIKTKEFLALSTEYVTLEEKVVSVFNNLESAGLSLSLRNFEVIYRYEYPDFGTDDIKALISITKEFLIKNNKAKEIESDLI